MIGIENFQDLFFFVLIAGFAIARISRLVMNEESFLWSGYIFRHLAGMRYKTRHGGDTWDKIKEQTLSQENIELPEEINSLAKLIFLIRKEKLGLYVLHSNSYTGKILACIFCTSVWIAIFAVFTFMYVENTQVMQILWGLFVASAISQIAIMAYKKT